MKKEIIKKEFLHLTLEADDIKELLPDEEFKYTLYWDYRDEIPMDLVKKQMPDKDNEYYRTEEGKFNWVAFTSDWELNIENEIYEMNWDMINEEICKEFDEKVREALKKKGIKYDELEFDFYESDFYSIDLDMDFLFGKSYVNFNICFDGEFIEDEKIGDGGCLDKFLEKYPQEKEKAEEIERACTEIYDGSVLKFNYRGTLNDFFNMLKKGKAKAYGTAVIHSSINGSGSSDFDLYLGDVELGEDWYWQFDGHYGIEETYGPVGGAFNTY